MKTLTSWIDIKPNSDFSIYNFPFGVAKLSSERKVAVSAIGDYVIDLDSLQNHFYFDELDLPSSIFQEGSLNEFIALGKPVTRAVRDRLIDLFSNTNTELRDDEHALLAARGDHDLVGRVISAAVSTDVVGNRFA